MKREARDSDAKTIRVLLAEDHDLVRFGLRSLLEESGEVTVVAEATNGREAVDVAPTCQADVAVLDIAMPILNGIGAARELLRLYPSIGIVMISMHASRQYIFEALRVGVLGYLLKDTAVNDILPAVREVAAGRRFLAPAVASIALDDYVERAANPGGATGLDQLSGREREVLQLLADGHTSAEIAIILSISPHTVDTHRRNMMTKLDLKNVVELVKFAIRCGLVSVDE